MHKSLKAKMNIKLEIRKRIVGIREDMEKNRIDTLLLSKPKNVLYLSGYETGQILITHDDAILWVKNLYRDIYELYHDRDYVFDIKSLKKNSVEKYITSKKFKKIGIEDLNLNRYDKLRGSIKAEFITMEIVENRRAVKSKNEIELLKKSADIAVKGMNRAYEVVQENVSEIDAVAEIEYTIRKLGSETPPFYDGMLLAYGPNGSDIHARASAKNIRNGLVVVDLGARYSGYYSDISRTIPVGNLRKNEGKTLEFVRNLELEVIDRIKVGVKAVELHSYVNKRIKRLGYEFYHSTGHGIGLEVHEKPSLGSESKDILKENMVFTIEPGVYIPKKFGVRFEDMILLTRNGPRILTVDGELY